MIKMELIWFDLHLKFKINQLLSNYFISYKISNIMQLDPWDLINKIISYF